MLIQRHICKMPDGTSLDLDIHQQEIYVFVDDDKGPKSGDPNNVMGMFARSFEKLDCDFFARLTRALVQREAWNWHASAHYGLHHDPNMRSVLMTLDKCKSRVFSFRRIERQLDGDDVHTAILNNMGPILNEWSDIWPTGNRQARLLLMTIKCTFAALLRGPWDIPRPKAITFFVDCMNFFPKNPLSLRSIPNLPGAFLALDVTTTLDIEIRVVSFFDRSQLPQWIRIYLGLVDGESWLHGRLLREAPTNCASIDEQGLAYANMTAQEAETFSIDTSCITSALEEMNKTNLNYKKLATKLSLYSRYWRRWVSVNRWAYNGIYNGDRLGVYPKPKEAIWVPK